jgi:hypothetical protein
MLETILCPNCKEKVLNERVSQAGKYFICNCGYDSRLNSKIHSVINKRIHSNIGPQPNSEFLSELTYLEEECKKMRIEIARPDALAKHIEALPKIYENLKVILKNNGYVY